MSDRRSHEQFRLIVGMSRAGTKAVMRSLNLMDDVAAYGESCFWGSFWVQPNADGWYHRAQLDRIKKIYCSSILVPFDYDEGGLCAPLEEAQAQIATDIDSLQTPVSPGKAFSVLGEAIAKTVGKDVWVEKTPHHLMYLDRILEHSPNARIIVMLRNPASFLLSYKHQGDNKPEKIRKRFHSTYHPAVVAFICRGYLRSALRAQEKWPENVKIVSLEKLIAEDSVTIFDIANHLELDSNSKLRHLNDNSSFESATARPALKGSELVWLRLFTKRYARELDLHEPIAGSGLFGFIGSVLSLPLWGVRLVVATSSNKNYTSWRHLLNWVKS